MITVPLINWQPMANMPEDRKDGRDILLAKDIGNEHHPVLWCYYIGQWCDRVFARRGPNHEWDYGPGWLTTEQDQSDRLQLAEDYPSRWADINPPT